MFKIYGSTEVAIGETIRQGFNEKRVMNFCGKTNLGSLYGIGLLCSVIGNDSEACILPIYWALKQ